MQKIMKELIAAHTLLSEKSEQRRVLKNAKGKFLSRDNYKTTRSRYSYRRSAFASFSKPKPTVCVYEFRKDAEVAEHSHAGQWAVVLDGEIELTVDGKKYVFKKGDTYYIPKGVKHSARIRKG